MTRSTSQPRGGPIPRASLLLPGLAALALGTGGGPAAASEMGELVKTICLGAFNTEMQMAGKVAPAGMADYACECVAQRLTSGSSLDGAKATCKQLTAKRYPL
jgi:hypothetical protein